MVPLRVAGLGGLKLQLLQVVQLVGSAENGLAASASDGDGAGNFC
jgi:hypothetical protein